MSGIIPKLKGWRLWTDGKSLPVPCNPVFVHLPLLFCWFVCFWFLYNQEPLWLRVRRDLDIIWQWQRMRETAWDRTPQACCRGSAPVGCQEWLRGPNGTSLRHVTSALQLSPALTLSRLKTHMELRQEKASGMWSITHSQSYYKNISSKNILQQLFSCTVWDTF